MFSYKIIEINILYLMSTPYIAQCLRNVIVACDGMNAAWILILFTQTQI